MGKIVFLMIIIILVLSTIIIIQGTKKSYEILPANMHAPLVTKPFEEWRDFAAKNGNFLVSLPVIPQHATENVPDASKQIRKYEMYVSEKSDGTIFMVSLITYPNDAETKNPDAIMNSVIQEMLESNSQNTLKEKNEIQFQNQNARQFKIENADITINGVEFIIDRTLYLLTYIAKKQAYNQDEYQHFIDSFQLVNQPEPASK